VTNPIAPITNQRILVTGVTGWVAGPLAKSLAAQGNTVFGAARFAEFEQRLPFEDAGVRTVSLDLGELQLDEVPEGLDLVAHFAVSKDPDFTAAMATNAHGSANLMAAAHERGAGVRFFHCSSTAVYEPAGQSPRAEDAPLGDSHRTMAGMPTYSISKIAGEVLVAHTARRLGVPTVIARLNVPYGDTYGWPLFHVMMMERDIPIPVHVNQPTSYTPIHADDINASIPYLMSYASPEAPAINWGGDEVTSIEEWCEFLGEQTDRKPRFAPTEATIAAIVPDLSKQQATGFKCAVGWREGFTRMMITSRPDIAKGRRSRLR
jgi:UDP-glucuronate 4-epimerase